MATLVFADTYAGWKGSLREDEVRARVAGVKRMLNGPAGGIRSTFPGMFAGKPPGDVVPLLDARSPLSVAREFARLIPHAQLVVIPGAGHMRNLERPHEFNAAVRAFCGQAL